MTFNRSVLACCVVAATASAAGAATIEGTVFDDRDGDGLFSGGDVALPGVGVGFEIGLMVKTDDAGRYRFSLPADGQVWVRTPDGFDPRPIWRDLRVAEGDRTVDLPLRTVPAAGTLSFVVGADSHVGINGLPLEDVRHSFAQAAATFPRPQFIVVVGDLIQGNLPTEFDDLRSIVDDLDVPFVPVIGNHDWWEGRDPYRNSLGPPQYCFDSGGMRFIVLDYALTNSPQPMAPQLAFIARCLDDVGDRPTAAFFHFPLDDERSLQIADAGVDYLFTGHWHANRTIDHGRALEINTQPLAMGGIDVTPAGYRVATWTGSELGFTHHTVVEQPLVRIVHPAGDACVPPGPLEVIVAAEAGAAAREAPALALDGSAAVTMASTAGWTYLARVDVAAGQHELVATLGESRLVQPFCVAARATTPALADWTQHQGSPEHEGRTATRIEPPLVHLWAASVGGQLRGGGPAVAAGRVFVPVVDLGSGAAGGVVAFDALSGARLWDRRVGQSVHGSPAVAGELVIFSSADGRVHAVGAADGATVWTQDLVTGMSSHLGWLYAAPTVADGNVYVGTQRKFVALDAATGRELWSRDPQPDGYWLASLSAAGVGGGVVIASFARGENGIIAWDGLDGRELWRVPRPLATALHASVVIDGDTAYLANSYAEIFALDLLTPAAPTWTDWRKTLHDGTDAWSYGIVATPALAGDRIIVPTMRGAVVALNKASGAELWRHTGQPANIRMVHYRGAGTTPFVSAPVVTNDIVWVGGADGTLSALDVESGDEMWNAELGVPILSAPSPAGDVLYVGTFDGTLHAMWHPPSVPTCPDAPGCVEPGEGGCAVGGSAGAWCILLVGVGVLALRRRRS